MFRKFFLWIPTFEKNGTYEEETGPTDSVRIQGFSELESKSDELEGKTNGASHDSLKTKNSISLWLKPWKDMNVLSAKRADRSMVSNTKYYTKTKSKFKDI